MALFKTTVCPYCYNKISASKLEWRCDSGRCKAPDKLEEDTRFSEYHDVHGAAARRMPHIINDPKPKNGFVVCDKCGDNSNMRICPVCHSALPKTDDNIIISIVGASGAGKSYFVGTLLKQLRAKLNAFSCSIQFTTTEAREMYENKFEKNFAQGVPIPATKPPADNINIVGANLPILCDLTDRRLKKRTFTFFDAAGENFENESIMRYVAPYISHSSAIILLLDPTQIPYVNSTLRDENPKIKLRDTDKNASYETILHNTIEVIHNHTRSTGRIKIPLAVGFSKWDLIENSPQLRPDEGSSILRPSPHFTKGFQKMDCDNVNYEIEGLLAAWGYENFIITLKQNFTNVNFFAFSAIGADVDERGNVPAVVPKRVEDPFLWLLNELGIIVR